MLAITAFIYIIWIFLRARNYKTLRRDLFTLCVILCLFFFSSSDPVIGMPLYMYPMLLSIAVSIFSEHKMNKINKMALYTMFILILCLIIPMVRLEFGMINEKFILLKHSITDVKNIGKQLFKPTLDFAVIKHFCFFVTYIIFVVFNSDLYLDNEYLKALIKTVATWFKILIAGLIIEWIVVNSLGGYNDREIMHNIFSISRLNQQRNWFTWGSYSVALWFPERSNYFIIAVYYLIMLKKQEMRGSDWLWIISSAFACYCTGSSSALAIVITYMITQSIVVLVESKRVAPIIIMSVIIITGGIILIRYYSVYAPKLIEFVSGEGEMGSAHWRAKSIEYGVIAIMQAPLFGIGIGTVYVHSMLIQTLANIGFVGVFITLWLHKKVCPFKFNFRNVLGIVFLVGISYGSFMVQNFTSPLIILVFIILHYRETVSNEKQNPIISLGTILRLSC